MGHGGGVSDLVLIIPHGSRPRSKKHVGDWGLHTDGQVSSVKGATIRAMRSTRPFHDHSICVLQEKHSLHKRQVPRSRFKRNEGSENVREA